MKGYLDAIRLKQGVELSLAQVDVFIPRARLRNHMLLGALKDEFCDKLRCGMVAESTTILHRYLFVSGLTEEQIQNASVIELMVAYLVLSEMNSFKAGDIAFLRASINKNGNSENAKLPYDYNDRIWALWITTLAEHYHWSRNDIFNLYPEEAAYYLQEALVSTYHGNERDRMLSPQAYAYDANTKKSKYVPEPKPQWMETRLEDIKKVRIPKSILPVGNVLTPEMVSNMMKVVDEDDNDD